MFTVKELNAVSDVSPGDMRAVLNLLLESRPLNDDSVLTPGETAVLLLFRTLENLGYERSRIFSTLQPFIPDIVKYAEAHQDLVPHNRDLGMFSLGDSRFALWGGVSDKVYDIKENQIIPALEHVPVITVSISMLALLRDTYAKIVRHGIEAEARQAAEASGDTAAGS